MKSTRFNIFFFKFKANLKQKNKVNNTVHGKIYRVNLIHKLNKVQFLFSFKFRANH